MHVGDLLLVFRLAERFLFSAGGGLLAGGYSSAGSPASMPSLSRPHHVRWSRAAR
jgi:hypothetical protein